MKKLISVLLVVACLASFLCISAGADEVVDGYQTPAYMVSGITAAVDKDNDKILNVTYTDVTNGEQYLILVLSDDSGTPTDSNIQYIDQKAAADGSVTFKVYPNSLKNKAVYYIYISGTNSELKLVATVEYLLSFITGDVNDDGEVDTTDRILLSRYIAEWDGVEINLEAGDIDKSGGLPETTDRIILSRYIAEWDGYDSYFA